MSVPPIPLLSNGCYPYSINNVVQCLGTLNVSGDDNI